MSGLPRDILRWMQSLDLSYAVKNIKRDFANGFLVAEILSRYYKNEIQMHSFDNGIGLVKRIQNWYLLEKFFKKVGFPISRSTIDAVIHCKKDAAIPLMEQLYTLLTHKTIQASKPIRDTEITPAFARPTASQLIKERLSEADLADAERLDARIAPGKAQQVLEDHMQKLKLERETDPARFQPKPHSNTLSATKSRPGANTQQAIQFKEVQVKQIDDRSGVLQARANHVYHQQNAAAALAGGVQAPTSPSQQSQASQSNSPSQAAATAAAGAAPGAAPVPVRPALQTLNQALIAIVGGPTSELGARLLGGADASSPTSPTTSATKDPVTLYADSVCLTLPDEQNAIILHTLQAQTLPLLVESSLNNPKDYWQLSNFLIKLLTQFSASSAASSSSSSSSSVPSPIPSSQAFAQSLLFLSNLGRYLVSRDPVVSAQLFSDFTLPKLLILFKNDPSKIFILASKLMYAFVNFTSAEHQRIIQEVREALLGGGAAAGAGGKAVDEITQRVFYAVLGALAPFEEGLLVENGTNPALLNLYFTCVEEGLSESNSPRTRAVALSILAPLSTNPNYGEEVLRPLLDKLRPLLPTTAPSQNNSGRNEEQGDRKEEEEKTNESDVHTRPSPSRSTGRGLANNEWVIDAELLHVLSCVLNHTWVQQTQSIMSEIYQWIDILLMGDSAGNTNTSNPSTVPFPTLQAGLSHLSSVLAFQPAIRKLWLKGFVLADPETRKKLLETDAQAAAAAVSDSTSSSSSASSSLSSELIEIFSPRLRSVWQPLTIVQTLADQVRILHFDNLSTGHIELIAAAVDDAFTPPSAPNSPSSPSSAAITPNNYFPDVDTGEWCRLFLFLREYFMVELWEEQHSEYIINILKKFLLELRTTATAQTIFLQNDNNNNGDGASSSPPPIYAILRLLYRDTPRASEGAQMNLAGFLEELASIPAFVALIHRNLAVFAQHEPAAFKESPLVNLLNKLDAQAAAAANGTQL